MANNERTYQLNEIHLGDEVVARNVSNSKTTLSGTVSRINEDPDGVDLEGIPFSLDLATSPDSAGWEIIEVTPAPNLPVDPGLYMDEMGYTMELTVDGVWLPPKGTGGLDPAVASSPKLVKIAPVTETAALVLDAVARDLPNSEASLRESVSKVGEQFGVEPTIWATPDPLPEGKAESPEPANTESEPEPEKSGNLDVRDVM